MFSNFKQSGMTLWSGLYVFGSLGFFIMCGVKIGPAYMNELSAKRAVEDVASKLSAGGTISNNELAMTLQKRWDIDYIKDLKASEVRAMRTAGGLVIRYEYEASIHLFGNVFVVLPFSNEFPIKAQLAG